MKIQEKKNTNNYLSWHDMNQYLICKSLWINMWKDYEWLTTNSCGLRRNILLFISNYFRSFIPSNSLSQELCSDSDIDILIYWLYIPWQTGRHNVKRVWSQLLPEYWRYIIELFQKFSISHWLAGVWWIL